MRFSVIIPSFLAPYAGAARQRNQKLVRAVNSVLAQSLNDFEVHVIADGCQETFDIISTVFNDERIKLWMTSHKKLWSGHPRNKGIDEANGDYIIYLDIDDVYGERHLEIINDEIKDFDWVWYNDVRYRPNLKVWVENECNIKQIGQHGTSNICHRRLLDMRWDEEGRYAHDYYFVQKLLRNINFTKVRTPEYFVCHIPGTQSSGGYDL